MADSASPNPVAADDALGSIALLDSEQRKPVRLCLSVLGALGTASLIGVAFSLYLVNHYPLLLIALSPLGRHMVLVAPMVAGGVETILGVQRDPLFGPAVMFGLGGVFVEALGDVVFRLAPFGLGEARRMIREIRGLKVLQGLRGAPPADLEALAEALVRLSVLAAAEAARIESIDVNPFLVLPEGQGAVALDAAIVVRRGSGTP